LSASLNKAKFVLFAYNSVVTYENNLKVGKGTVIITGDGENYYGQKKVTFLILPKWAMWIW